MDGYVWDESQFRRDELRHGSACDPYDASMRYRVCKLEGGLLDAAVAKAEGWHRQVWESAADFEWRGAPESPECMLGPIEAGPEYSPSTDWAHGGPLVERERIYAIPRPCGGWVACRLEGHPPDSAEDLSTHCSGATLLVAAMRAHVQNKLGDEVDLP